MRRWIANLMMVPALAFAEERPLVHAINLAEKEPESIERFLDSSKRHVSAYDSEGKTLILWAAKTGQAEVIRRLVARGADVNQVSRDGYELTPLICAAGGGYLEAVEALIQLGAKIQGDSGRRAVLSASVYNTKAHAKVIHILVKAGAESNGDAVWRSLYERRLISLEALFAAGADINQRGQNEITPVLYAVAGRDIRLLRLILKHQPNLNLMGRFPFAFHGSPVIPPSERYFDRTPLMQATVARDQRIVEMLLNAGADPAIKNRHGQTASDLSSSLISKPLKIR